MMNVPGTGDAAEDSQPQAWRYLGLVLLVSVLVFIPAAGFEFVNLDDNINVYRNGNVTDPSLPNILEFWKGPYQNLYIPLTYTLWALQAKLSALFLSGPDDLPDPFIFHTINILVHLVTIGGIFAIIRTLVKDLSATVIGTLLFAIHPVQVQPVVWVTGFKDVLCGMWSVLAIWQYCRYTQAGSRKHRGWYYAVATICFSLALLSKPSAVVLPLVVGTIAYLLLNRKLGALLLELLPWVILSLPQILVSRQAQSVAPKHLFLPSLGERFLVAGDAITFYLSKFILPMGLTVDYGRTPQFVLGEWWIYFTGIIPYVLAALVMWKMRHRWLLAVSLIFVISLTPVLGFVTFDFQYMSTVANRYLYLAIFGPVIGISHWLAGQRKKLVIILALGVVTLLGIKSAIQVQTWRDSRTLYQHTIKINPRSWVAYSNLGRTLIKLGEIEEATYYFLMAVQANPNSAKAHFNLGSQYRNLNQPEKAIVHYRKAVELRPTYELAYVNLGDTYLGLARKEETIWPYQQAVQLNPDLEPVHMNLLQVYRDLGKEEEGIAFYQDLIARHPGSGHLHRYPEFLSASVIHRPTGQESDQQQGYPGR
jgi:hypothetical protein